MTMRKTTEQKKQESIARYNEWLANAPISAVKKDAELRQAAYAKAGIKTIDTMTDVDIDAEIERRRAAKAAKGLL